jgi:hypothetical protein
MQRDIRFSEYAGQQARNRSLEVLVVDQRRTLDENKAFVEDYFRLTNKENLTSNE